MVLYPKKERDNLLSDMLYAQRRGLIFEEYRGSRDLHVHQIRECKVRVSGKKINKYVGYHLSFGMILVQQYCEATK